MEKKLLALSFVLLWFKLSSAHDWVPQYHLAPQTGWLNNPNGLIYFDGYYQAFYQYNPDAPEWGPSIHWGHARSIDMLSWEHLPIALAPSIPEDINGVDSGSAVIENGNLTVIYTGIQNVHQKQCLATSSDGISFVKEGVVLQRDGDDQDFRDPKVWWQNDSWYMVLGSRTSDNKGEVLLYKSPDLRGWEFEGVLAQADDKLGYMWESPDFFTLGEKQILLVSPNEMVDAKNKFQSGYFVGTWAPGSEYQIEKGFTEIDHGHDFYASQTFLAPDGRRIMIAWLSMWLAEFPETADGWAGMLTLPRELTLSSSGDLEIRPIREIQDRRRDSAIQFSNYVFKGNTNPITLSQFSAEFIVDFNISDSSSRVFGIEIGSSTDSDEGVQVYVNATSSSLFLERSYPDYNIERSSRSVLINDNEILSLNIFLDQSSIEVFVNDGEAVMSSRIYPSNNTELVFSFFSVDGGTVAITGLQSWYL